MIEQYLPYALAAGGGFLALKFGPKISQRIDDRHMAALNVAAVLRAKGLSSVPKSLEYYATGDLSGFAQSLKALAGILLNPQTADAEFENVFDKALMEKLTDPTKRKALMEKISVIGTLGAPTSDSVSADPA